MNKNYFLVILSFLLLACNSEPTQKTNNENRTSQLQYLKLQGKTMGTTYHITYGSKGGENYQKEIDDLLVAINADVNTYDPNSYISQFNKSQENKYSINKSEYPHFIKNVLASKTIFENTNGFFDPTVMPLVNYWGFGYTPKEKVTKVDEQKIATLLKSVGFEKIDFNIDDKEILELTKQDRNLQLDFSALAKGYGVDEVARFLESKGVENYLVEIGGETRGKGRSFRNVFWSLAISDPRENAPASDANAILELQNKAVATSGNYRNFYKVGDKTYSHTIHPKTGMPERNTILGATVLADECMIADAYATAFMVMGVEEAMKIVNATDELEAYLLYSSENDEIKSIASEGIKPFLK